ncbi:hypothetical protein SKAU_G00110750 [Synaphobranchus kaupii]|uniref:Uncharacterized protein n=1 Tax=Synaphobranchus kaupii TaxID=118154 RepID=A0A9Q1G123_SYNKA|nr:hypothetical protein SKAU_G00110750 [Synaphobranchus kaupii]
MWADGRPSFSAYSSLLAQCPGQPSTKRDAFPVNGFDWSLASLRSDGDYLSALSLSADEGNPFLLFDLLRPFNPTPHKFI